MKVRTHRRADRLGKQLVGTNLRVYGVEVELLRIDLELDFSFVVEVGEQFIVGVEIVEDGLVG